MHGRSLAVRAYPEFLTTIKERMSSGMSLEEALQSRHDGRYNCFEGKTVGQKKMHLKEICEQTLNFDVAVPGQLIGATAEDREMGTDGHGLTRAILEVMIDGFQRLVYEEDEAVHAKMILEELEKGDFDEYFEPQPLGPAGRPLQAEQLDLPQVSSALKRMGRPNANRPAVVLRTGPTGKPRFYLNSEGVDRLPGRDRSHRPHHQPAPSLSEAQIVELMNNILAKAADGVAVLKLSGVPRSTGHWQEQAYKQLARLVHPNKWQQHGADRVDLATKAFQVVKSAWDQHSGRSRTFVPDETDQQARHAQRETVFAQQMAANSSAVGASSATEEAEEADDEEAPIYRSLSTPAVDPPPVAPTASFTPTASFGPPPIGRSASLSMRELRLQRAQREAQDMHEYEAAQVAAQKAIVSLARLGLTVASADDQSP